MTAPIRKMQRAAKRMREAEAAHKAAKAEAQRTCPHPSVFESPFNAGVMFDRLPTRVCQACGLIEGGWTFRVLPEPIFKASYDQVHAMAHAAVYGGKE